MKHHRLLVTIVGIVFIITAALLYVLFLPQEEDSSNTTGNQPQTSPSSQSSEERIPPKKVPAGKYIAYSEVDFAKHKESRRVIFFHAPWCPQCRTLEKSIQEGTIPAGMVILKTDYDTSNGLKQTYGVTLQTTLVEVDENGKLKKKFAAYDEPSLQAVINALGR